MKKRGKEPGTKHDKKKLVTIEHRGRGQPRFEINEELLFKLAESMLPVESIAKIIGCHPDTIYANFSEVLQKAREGRKKLLSMAMWEKALIEKDTKMMIWLSKQHLGYKDVVPESAQQITFNVVCKEIPK